MLEWDQDHGPTDYNNGIQLCGNHHRYVHEGKWKIRGNPDQEITFIRPDGKEFTGLAPQRNTKIDNAIINTATAAAKRAMQEHELARQQRQEELERRQQVWEQEARERKQQLEQWRRERAEQSKGSPEWGDPAA